MPPATPVFQILHAHVERLTKAEPLRRTTLKRLLLFLTAVLTTGQVTRPTLVRELLALGLTAVRQASVARRLRRTLDDPFLTPERCYQPALRTLLRGRRRFLLALDETSHTDRFHLLRLSLVWQGTAIPLTWSLWPTGPCPDYATRLDRVLDEAAALLPAGAHVIVLADRAYDIPSFIDRLTRRKWHALIRFKHRSDVRWRRPGQAPAPLRPWLEQQLAAPGCRVRVRCWLYQQAGWRRLNVVGHWQAGHDEPLVVVTDLPLKSRVLEQYRCRYWIEAGFRLDKRGGWHWEASRVEHLARQERLLVVLAWAMLVSVQWGELVAKEEERPGHASLGTLGRWVWRAACYGTRTLPTLPPRFLRLFAPPPAWLLPSRRARETVPL